MKLFGGPVVVLIMLLAGCASGAPPALPEGMVECHTPRPQVCTMEYDPVCAVLDDGERKQYANGCSACGDAAVTGYLPGPCE